MSSEYRMNIPGVTGEIPEEFQNNQVKQERTKFIAKDIDLNDADQEIVINFKATVGLNKKGVTFEFPDLKNATEKMLEVKRAYNEILKNDPESLIFESQNDAEDKLSQLFAEHYKTLGQEKARSATQAA